MIKSNNSLAHLFWGLWRFIFGNTAHAIVLHRWWLWKNAINKSGIFLFQPTHAASFHCHPTKGHLCPKQFAGNEIGLWFKFNSCIILSIKCKKSPPYRKQNKKYYSFPIIFTEKGCSAQAKGKRFAFTKVLLWFWWKMMSYWHILTSF